MKLSDLDVSETLKFLVTYSGVFLASAYVAGRIYLQTYFSVFQLDPIVLDFEPQDIAFQSRSVWVPIGVLIVLFPIRFNANKLSKVIALPRIAIILLAVLIVIAIRTGMDIVLYSVSDWRGVLGGNLNILPILTAGVVLLAVLPNVNSARANFSWLLGLVLLFVLLLPAAAGLGRGLENRFGHPVGSFQRVSLTSDIQLLEDWDAAGPGTFVSPSYYLLGVSNSYIAVWDSEEERPIVIGAGVIHTIRHD